MSDKKQWSKLWTDQEEADRKQAEAELRSDDSERARSKLRAAQIAKMSNFISDIDAAIARATLVKWTTATDYHRVVVKVPYFSLHPEIRESLSIRAITELLKLVYVTQREWDDLEILEHGFVPTGRKNFFRRLFGQEVDYGEGRPTIYEITLYVHDSEL